MVSCVKVQDFVALHKHHMISFFAPAIIITPARGYCHLNLNRCHVGVLAAMIDFDFFGRTVSKEST